MAEAKFVAPEIITAPGVKGQSLLQVFVQEVMVFLVVEYQFVVGALVRVAQVVDE